MQKLDLNKKNYTYNDVKELVDELEEKKIITSKEAEAININKIYQFTRSKIWNEMIEAKEVQREKPFYINIPAKEIYKEDLDENVLVQGVIDLYYINSNGELVLVDFKTDYVENRDENILIDKYKVQLDLYKRALRQALNRDVDRVYIYSTYFDKEIIYQKLPIMGVPAGKFLTIFTKFVIINTRLPKGQKKRFYFNVLKR